MAKNKTGDWRVSDEDEALMEDVYRTTGNLHVLADRLCLGLQRGEVSPALAWVHKHLLGLANASVNIKPYRRLALRQVRYLAVREAHDREGYTWEEAPDRAAEVLRGQPAAAGRDWMWKEYLEYRKALRAAGVPDDDPGYRWVDQPDKS